MTNMRKLALKLFGPPLATRYGVFQEAETLPASHAFHEDVSLPEPVSIISGDPLASAGIVRRGTNIAMVLMGSRNAEIAVSVVEPISVDMVSLLPVAAPEPKNLTVHKCLGVGSKRPMAPDGIPSLSIGALQCPPSILTQLFESMRRYFRNLAFSEGNFTIVFRWGGHARCSYQRVGFVRHLQCLTTPLYLTGF